MAQCVMTSGMSWRPEWSADNSVTLEMVTSSVHKEPHFIFYYLISSYASEVDIILASKPMNEIDSLGWLGKR